MRLGSRRAEAIYGNWARNTRRSSPSSPARPGTWRCEHHWQNSGCRARPAIGSRRVFAPASSPPLMPSDSTPGPRSDWYPCLYCCHAVHRAGDHHRSNPHKRSPGAFGTRYRVLPARSVAGPGRSRRHWLAPRPRTRKRSRSVSVERPGWYYVGRRPVWRVFRGKSFGLRLAEWFSQLGLPFGVADAGGGAWWSPLLLTFRW